ncbi:MAG: tRNA (guanosine(37)-N1)-methyltransferase TrmD [Oleiphilus sp.]|nr:MAG: tRNA (guanosine(37)-N1)-methyltransferase TrmD [Oleiphilus sp.]
MWFGLVTLFPEMFESIEEHGVVGRAVKNGLVRIKYWNPREFTSDRHRTVDDRPYGGGPGMLMKVQPLQDAIQAAKQAAEAESGGPATVVYLSPQGKAFDHAVAQRLAGQKKVILIAGRYEGVDERLLQTEVDEEISLGDFVLSGGEIAAMAVVDAVSRLVPDVLGHEDSAQKDSFVHGVLDCPHYTRPEVYRGMQVPDVLLSGNHSAIEAWREKQALGRTWQRRPDLLKKIKLSPEQQGLLQEFINEANR